MFTADNCEYSQTERIVLNAALNSLLATAPASLDEDTRWQLEQSYSDRLCNAWRPGVSSVELVEAAKLS